MSEAVAAGTSGSPGAGTAGAGTAGGRTASGGGGRGGGGRGGGDTAPPPPAGGPGYPRHWEADVVASDGGVVHLRPILPTDADALVALHDRLSARTRYLRYFGPHPYLSPKELERFTVVDHRTR